MGWVGSVDDVDPEMVQIHHSLVQGEVIRAEKLNLDDQADVVAEPNFLEKEWMDVADSCPRDMQWNRVVEFADKTLDEGVERSLQS